MARKRKLPGFYQGLGPFEKYYKGIDNRSFVTTNIVYKYDVSNEQAAEIANVFREVGLALCAAREAEFSLNHKVMLTKYLEGSSAEQTHINVIVSVSKKGEDSYIESPARNALLKEIRTEVDKRLRPQPRNRTKTP